MTRGPAGRVSFQFKAYPFNRGKDYKDRPTGHTLRRIEGDQADRWTCNACPFDVPEDRYLTWRALIEDHRHGVGIT